MAIPQAGLRYAMGINMKRKMNHNLWMGCSLCFMILGFMIYSYICSEVSVNQMQVGIRFLGPSPQHLFGTDNFGRDILVRIVSAIWKTLNVAVLTVVIGACVGFILGAIAGWFGGFVDEIIMRGCDIITAFPWLLLALVIITALGTSNRNIVIALGSVFIPSYTRVNRSCYMRLKNAEYVNSARMAGAGTIRILIVHILPNISTELLSQITVGFANAILSEAALSFLGLGIQPPDPSLGRMLSEAQEYLFKAPWMAIMPGLTIIVIVLAFNYLGEGLKQKYQSL
ncbi:MAG: ABC transporter permease [Anaerocolumna sp.]